MPFRSWKRGFNKAFSKPSDSKEFRTWKDAAKIPVLVGVLFTTSFMRSTMVWYICGVLLSIDVVTPRDTAANTCSFGKGEGTTNFTVLSGKRVIFAKASSG